jgi:hypothetical protein
VAECPRRCRRTAAAQVMELDEADLVDDQMVKKIVTNGCSLE